MPNCAQGDPLGVGGWEPFRMRLMLNRPKRELSCHGWAEPPLSGSFPAPIAEVRPVKAGTLYSRAFFDLPLRT